MFKIGDVCIGQNFVHPKTAARFNGQECVVIEPIAERSLFHRGVRKQIVCLKVHWADGRKVYIDPICVRLKKPPTGEESILRMFQHQPQKEIENA